MMLKIRFVSAVIIALVTLTATPLTAATSAQLEQAEALLTAQKPGQALRLLTAHHIPGQSSVQELFLLGMAAKQSGKLSVAERYLRDAITQAPAAGRIRLELAEILYIQRRFEAARAELVAVRAMNPPEQVLENIDGFIAQVDAAKANPRQRPQSAQKPFGTYVTVGVTSDSNVNAGPDTDQVFLYGLPFTLSRSAQETDDTAIFLRAGVSHQAQLGHRLVWRSNANFSVTDYFEMDAYDTSSLSLATGPAFEIGSKVSLSLPVNYSLQHYNQQSRWYSQSWGIAPRLQYVARPNLQFLLDSSISRKIYSAGGSRDLTAYVVNPSVSYQPTANSNLAFGLQYGREDSGLEVYSNTVHGAYLGYQYRFETSGLIASVTASYTDTKFSGIQPAYRVARHDISRKLTAGLSYPLPQLEGLTLDGSVSYQDNDSNLDINSYDRTVFSASVTKRW